MTQQVTEDPPSVGPGSAAAEAADSPGVRRLYSAAMIADLLAVPPAAIRHWIRSGLLEVAERAGSLEWLDFGQLVVGRHLAGLLGAGLSLREIDAKLADLAPGGGRAAAGAGGGAGATQCPIFDHFQAAAPALDVRFLDRDARPDIAAHLKVCGGQRVPTVMFLSEDFTPILFYGDQTLSAYRAAAAAQLGESCSSGAVPPPAEAIAAVVADWLDQFERAQLILRLSGRLRQLHGD